MQHARQRGDDQSPQEKARYNEAAKNGSRGTFARLQPSPVNGASDVREERGDAQPIVRHEKPTKVGFVA